MIFVSGLFVCLFVLAKFVNFVSVWGTAKEGILCPGLPRLICKYLIYNILKHEENWSPIS